MAQCKKCHGTVERLMNYCPHCGTEQTWKDIHGNDECAYCGTEAYPNFNFCFACGKDIEPTGWNEPQTRAKGFHLSFECDYECGGNVQLYMGYCPWCGEGQFWEGFHSGDVNCKGCRTSVSTEWNYCVYCGEGLGEFASAHGRYSRTECPICGREFKRGVLSRLSGYPKRKGGKCQLCGQFVCHKCLARTVLKNHHLPKKLWIGGPRRERGITLCADCFKKVY